LALIVFRLERIFASAIECVSHQEAWHERGITLHVLDVAGLAVDLDSASGALVMGVMRCAREMELVTRERGALPSSRRRERGDRPLLGERVVRGYIVPDPIEQRAVERIEALKREGKSLRLIAEALDREGVPTKRRARRGWSKEAIRLILARIERGEVRSLRVAKNDPALDG